MHRQTGLNMALKPFHILEKEKRHQLYREISALQACALDACDHLIKLYDAFFDDEYVYMVLEYMNGGSLRHGTRQPIRLLDARVTVRSIAAFIGAIVSVSQGLAEPSTCNSRNASRAHWAADLYWA